ncbi:MAG: hypothetical protein OXE87_09210 [Chloroflexi bacterium]|nr:hypothetical protein [Chloroflexota bacterium]
MEPEPPDQSPDSAYGAANYPRPSGWGGKLAASSPAQARRWMRWAWLASLAWWVWNTGLLLVWIVASVIPPDPAVADADAPVPARIIIYYGVEGFVIGLLGLGLNFRWRTAGLLLPVVFLITRVIALTRLEPLAIDIRAFIWVIVYLLVLFLFIRGAQGAWSFHWFTHLGFSTRDR